jgi:uncharacterized membrane protein YfcA
VLGTLLFYRKTTADAQVLALWGVPLVLLVSWWANRFTRRLSQAQFARYVAVLLILAGVVAIARAFH